MTDNEWTKARRFKVVIESRKFEEVVGEGLGPPLELLNASNDDKLKRLKKGDTVWKARVITQTGLDKEERFLSLFVDANEADSWLAMFALGTKVDEKFRFAGDIRSFVESLGENAASKLSNLYLNANPDDSFGKYYKALAGAGVISEETFDPSPKVIEWLGDQHLKYLKRQFGENWEFVAEYEYTIAHYPPSSLAHLSALFFFYYFVSRDDYCCGYVAKEIEAIRGGAEPLALKSLETRKRAGKGGGKSSSERRTKCLEALMSELERLSDMRDAFSEERIFEQAMDNVSALDTGFTKTKKTRESYAITCRSEEPFKSRYEAIFRRNA